mmetsp:Transcript_71733/g.126624  ORF Transcript_71733/g.126624 Transcript_71733/m.126624 type:complete len:439 (+) Transcript_71733:44-1360(+)
MAQIEAVCVQDNSSDSDDSGNDEEADLKQNPNVELSDDDGDPPPVRVLLLAFMFMFQGYGVMVGSPAHALKVKLGVTADMADEFQEATASFQLAKLSMRILQIAFLVFVQPNGIVYISYVVMMAGLLVPVVFVWGAGVTGMWVVYLQYILGGIAVGLFEGTFLSVISSLGKNTKTFAIMGAPLGFFLNNTVLATFTLMGMPVIFYYLFGIATLPVAMWIYHKHRPDADPASKGKGCAVFMHSMKHAMEWMPLMLPWFLAKFIGNFVLEDGFPLLFNTFNTQRVPFWGGPADTENTIPFSAYTAFYWFPMMAAGDTISRRLPRYVSLTSWQKCYMYLGIAILLCVGGEALTFLLIAIVTGIATFISNFGNGFIYGLSAKYIDSYIAEEHRYAAYNLWCFCGDLGGYAGQGGMSVSLAHKACAGKEYTYVCHGSSHGKHR